MYPSLAAGQGDRPIPPTLSGAILDLGRAHRGRFERHEYVLMAQGGKLTAVFAPLPLAHTRLREVSRHLLRAVFGAEVATTVPAERYIESVPALAFTIGQRGYLVLPIRNGRGLVHSVLLWVEAPADPFH